MTRKTTIPGTLAALAAAALLNSCATPPPPYAKSDKKAAELVSKMTLDEKLKMIHGCGFNTAPVPRLGLGPINMSGSSLGLTQQPWPACKGLEPATALPSTILLAATWNRDAAYEYAKAISEEFRARNMHILLGPGVNIYRNPLCGRNYEYMGEDPYLASEIVVPYVKAARDVGVIPTVKHFVANQTDPLRKQANSVVSERALREIYFPVFKASVLKGDTLGIMTSYNLLNGVYTAEDKWLIKDVLGKEWGFRGFVVSDWNSLWHSELAANSGLDIEMPGGKQGRVLAPENVRKLLEEKKTTVKEIDSKIYHIVRSCMEMGLYDKNWAKPELNKLDEHDKVALETAREGITLLQNKNKLLPLEPSKIGKIVVIGPTAGKTPITGGGSGAVLPYPKYTKSIWDGIKKIYGDKAILLSKFDKAKIKNADAVLVCVGYNTGIEIKDYRKDPKWGTVDDEQRKFNEGNKIKNPWGLDTSEHEGNDRESYSLPKNQNALIQKCAAANPNVVVAYTAGGGIAMPWADKVKSILWLYYPGQNGAVAAAEIIAGKINPSGKTPVTIEKRLQDNAAFGHLKLSWNIKQNGPPKDADGRKYWDIPYPEGIFVGYRHMDKDNIAPRFPFGHGLSYTAFEYRNLAVEKEGDGVVTVSFDIENTGKRAGKEVAQVYVADPAASVPRPPKELKGFVKVPLEPGEKKRVSIRLDKSAFSFWNPKTKKWTLEPGDFKILVGASSRDIKLSKKIEL